MDLNGGKGWDAALNKKLIYMVMGILILILLRDKDGSSNNSRNNSNNHYHHQNLNNTIHPINHYLGILVQEIIHYHHLEINNNKLGYQSIQQQQQDSRNAKFFNSNNAQQQQQQQAYLQQNGMIPIRDNDVELHSDMSSYTRKRSGTWLSWIFVVVHDITPPHQTSPLFNCFILSP